MQRMVVFGLMAFLLAACVNTPPVPAGPPVADTCGAGALQGLVGQDRKVLEAMKFAGPVRVIEPGMAVTMDYLDTRTNIQLDAGGLITAVTCG